jgi:hypothetical protein
VRKIQWKEVFKFLSGFLLASSLFNFYLYLYNIPAPFMRFTFSPGFLGIRAAGQFVLFLVLFYFGYLKK